MIHFTCLDCGKPLQVDEDLAGKRIRCRHCDEPQEVPRPKRAAREPWFYRYLETGSHILIWLAVAGFVLTVLGAGSLFIMTVIAEANAGHAPLASLMVGISSVAWAGAALVGLLWTIFLICFALLIIDIGRSLRAIRHNTEPKQAQTFP